MISSDVREGIVFMQSLFSYVMNVMNLCGYNSRTFTVTNTVNVLLFCSQQYSLFIIMNERTMTNKTKKLKLYLIGMEHTVSQHALWLGPSRHGLIRSILTI